MRLEIRNRLHSTFNKYNLWRLEKNVVQLNNVAELKKLFGWTKNAVLQDPTLNNFEMLADVNERRVRDAEVIGTVCANVTAPNILEIGTSHGHGTAHMAMNAPNSHVYTLNILPEEVDKGGGYNTFSPEKDKIGAYYRQQGLKNITQVFANTATWKPDLKDVGIAFIDGCHDTEFVVSDTLKAMKCMAPGSFVLWHDFHPELTRKFDWIYEVCLGVEKLIAKKAVKGRIFHVKDSWVGIYQLPNTTN